MPELTGDELRRWRETQPPGRPVPGNPEKVEGKCNADLRTQNKGLRDITCETSRFCGRKAGWGTTHVGTGTCKSHLGNTSNHILSAEREIVRQDYMKFSERMKMAVAPGEPEVMMSMIAGRMWFWYEFCIQKMDEIENNPVYWDGQGVQRVQAMLEAFERSGSQAFEVVKFMSQHKLAERLVALEEYQARHIANIFLTVINDYRLPLDDAAREIAKTKFALEMEKAGTILEPSWSSSGRLLAQLERGEVIDVEIAESVDS